MTTKAAEKIIDALTELMEGYAELQQAVEEELGTESDEETEEGELNAEVDAALVAEVRSALETVLENEDYTPQEFASVISALTDSLQEIDPQVFAEQTFESEDEEEDDIDDEDYEDLDEDADLDEEDDE